MERSDFLENTVRQGIQWYLDCGGICDMVLPASVAATENEADPYIRLHFIGLLRPSSRPYESPQGHGTKGG